ncbi:hypothetical protein RhiirA4_423241 [Rhizophagus irregularis]|uniref:RING-type domain-containing protein n=2 Tax=Rhizophagus irregularis TaxID=588596 RepID=A0A2I1GT41_9GLOM|nr:hypothetical protein RhiirA4_423241 [Rhizophagus irregularis]
MENQEGLSDVENPPSVENLSITEEVDLNSMEDVIITESGGQQNRDIPNRNKHLKTIALNILKYLPEDILREEPDFSAIKSSGVTIPDNGLCTYCEKPILSDNSPRSVVINVCGHIHHRSCAKEIDRRGVLSCGTCHASDDSDPLILTTQTNKCAKCSQEISTQPSEPLVTFPSCKHIVHFECIEINRKLCPKCPTNYDLEKEGFYISPEIPRKRRRQEGEQKSTRGSKAQTIIRELSDFTLDELSINAPSESLNMQDVSNQLHKMYYDIDVAEKKGDQANRDVVLNYFRFGKALSERLSVLLQKKPPQTAHTDLNSEVQDKLPDHVNRSMVRKRVDTARKIYDIFSVIGEDKIRRIKSFTASSFSDLTRPEVAYIIKNFKD